MSIHLRCRYHRLSGHVIFYLTLHLWARSEHALLMAIQGEVMPEPSAASDTIRRRVSEEGRLDSGCPDRHRRRHSNASLQCPEQCLRAASLASSCCSRTAQASHRDLCHICQSGVDYLGSTWECHVEEDVLFNRANQAPWIKEWGSLTKNFFFSPSYVILCLPELSGVKTGVACVPVESALTEKGILCWDSRSYKNLERLLRALWLYSQKQQL